MVQSPLVNKPAVPHRNKYNSRRGTPVSRIILHNWAGTSGGDTHLAKSSVKASTNYFVYTDGGIAIQVPEEYRAWTSSSASADAPSITIETQNSTMGPNWKVSDKALRSIINLIVDVARRYEWGTITPSRLRGHKEFSNTTCPGPYLWARMAYIRDEANKILSGTSSTPTKTEPETDPEPVHIPEEEEVPNTNEIRTVTKLSGEGWDNPDEGWALSGERPLVESLPHAQCGNVTAQFDFPFDVEILARFASWDDVAKRWTRYPAELFNRGTGSISMNFRQAGPHANMLVDFKASEPIEVGSFQTAMTWKVTDDGKRT